MQHQKVAMTAQPVEPVETYGANDIPPHMAQSKVNTVLIKLSDWLGSKAEVIDESTQEVLYNIKYKTFAPQVRIYAPGNDSEIGSATYHLTTTRIDIDVRGQALKMKNKSIFSSSFVYDSPGLQNQKMLWKSSCGWKTMDYVCLDENQLPLARFSSQYWLSKKIGKLELLGPISDNAAVKEEISFTSLAVMYYILIANTSAAVS